jgi:hypothetical protein
MRSHCFCCRAAAGKQESKQACQRHPDRSTAFVCPSAAVRYTFEYPAGWKQEVPSKVRKKFNVRNEQQDAKTASSSPVISVLQLLAADWQRSFTPWLAPLAF